VNSLSIGEQDDSKIPRFGFDIDPSTNPTVGLYSFNDRLPDRQFDPCIEDTGSIRPLPHVTEVRGGLHEAQPMRALRSTRHHFHAHLATERRASQNRRAPANRPR
jgi:hypothetical protein